MMESVLDIGNQPHTEMHPRSTEMVEQIFCDCIAMLD
jgi:hypothetical protein